MARGAAGPGLALGRENPGDGQGGPTAVSSWVSQASIPPSTTRELPVVYEAWSDRR